MQILVSKNGQQHGPYGLNELRQLVLQGKFTVDDSACFDGHNWGMVSEVPDFTAGSHPTPPPPPAKKAKSYGKPEASREDTVKITWTDLEKTSSPVKGSSSPSGTKGKNYGKVSGSVRKAAVTTS